MGQGLISEDLINQIRDRVDITEVVGHHVSLTRAGQNLKGLCPFHQEKTPSFTVSPSRQIFHCFGCGAGGNVFTFLMRITGTGFPEIVRDLGRRVGIEVPDGIRSSTSQAAQAGRLEALNQAAADWFQRNLDHPSAGREARTYLRQRGIEPETIAGFGIGLALPEWEALIKALSTQGFSPADMASAGLAVSREDRTPGRSGYYDRFRGRVVFPIRDLRKRVLGFGGRVLDDGTPKYLNSPETALFKKGQALFGLDAAREAMGRLKTVIVVEGYFDAIALHQAGLRHAVATLGTALTPDHVHVIRRFASNVVLLFDPDAAGVRAALRGLDLFVNSGLSVKVVSLPSGEDPDTFVRKEGAEGFSRLEERAPSLLDFAMEESLRTAESSTLEGRIRSVDEILRILQKSEHPIEREERLRVVAERLGISQQRLIERYPSLVGPTKSRGLVRAAAVPNTAFRVAPEERDLVQLLLQGSLAPADVRRLRPDVFSIPACRRLVQLAVEGLDCDGRVGVRALLDRAMEDPECGPLATELSMREDHYEDVQAHVKDCLDRLERKRSERVLRDLIVKLKSAEQEGREEDARALNAQVNELRMRKAGTVSAAPASVVKE